MSTPPRVEVKGASRLPQEVQLHPSPREETDTLRHLDRARSSASHVAQLTLISVLAGAMLGTLITGLPSGFARDVWVPSNVEMDIRVIAIILAIADVWIKFSWSVAVVHWPFSVSHTLLNFLLCVTVIGAGLSVTDSRAWLAWATAFAFAGALTYVFDARVIQKDYRPQGVLIDDPPYTPIELRSITLSFWWELPLALVYGVVLLYGTLNAFRILPNIGGLAIPSVAWATLIAIGLVFDVAVQGIITMPRQRYGPLPSSLQ